MPSPVTVDSHSGSSRRQEVNAGAPSKRYKFSGNNSSSPVHHALALHASGQFSCPISPVSFSVSTAQITITNKR